MDGKIVILRTLKIMLGIGTVILGAIFLTFHNVAVRILFTEQLLLGAFWVGGYVQPNLQSSMLLMVQRMVLVVPLMAVLSLRLYPSALKELRFLVQGQQWTVLQQAVGCGALMFLNIALLYIAIGLIPTGIAMTLFFTYPVFTALLSWRFFGDRPTLFRWVVMGIILVGSALTIPQSSSIDDRASITLGILASVGGGVVYAFYSVIAQKCFQALHPIPFTWVSFTVTLFLSGLSLLLFPLPNIQALDWTPLWIGGIFSGLMSFVGHTLHNLGIRMIGATAASITGSGSPAITALMAWATIREALSSLQVTGIVIVTLGIALLSGEGSIVGRSRKA